MSEEATRIRVATTRTNADKPEATGAAVYVLNVTAQTFNGEEDAFLSEKEWRRMFVEFPLLHSMDEHLQLNRKRFPSEIPWVDLTCGDVLPARWISSLIALRGTIVRFDVDRVTGQEEVDIAIELFPPHSDLLALLKMGSIADKLFTACMRSVNLFPRGCVEEGSMFTAYLSMGYQRSWTKNDPDEFHLSKVVWDLNVSGPPEKSNGWLLVRGMHDVWKRLRGHGGRPVWSPSEKDVAIYSPAEASLIMDLHLVLFQLWNARFGRNPSLVSQLKQQASNVVQLGPVRAAYGKSSLRPWTGPDLFLKSS